MKLLSKDAKSIEVEFAEENETVLNLLKSNLLARDEVEEASYLMGHPTLDKPKFFLHVNKGKPDQLLRQAAKEIRSTFDELETAIVNHKG